MQLLFNPAIGPVDLVTGRNWAIGGDVTVDTVSRGKVFNYPGVEGSLNYTGYPEISGTVGTFFIWCPTIGPKDDWGHNLLSDGTASYLSHQFGRFFFRGAESDRNISWFNTTDQSLVCSSAGTTGARLKVYQNGTDTGMLFSAAPAAWASGSRVISLGKSASGTIHDFRGTIRIAGYTTAVWGAAEARAFHEAPWLVLKAPPRRIFSVAAIVEVIGTSATTNADDVSEATGAVSAGVTGTVAYTNENDTSSAAGTTTVTGSGATTNADDTSAASGSSGSTPTVFASDTFTDTDGVTLQAHDANWVKHTLGAGNDILITANRAQLRVTGEGFYYHSASPSSADYSVSVDLYTASYSPAFNATGVTGRTSTTANTFYHARHRVTGGWELYKRVDGTFTLLGSSTVSTPSGGTTVNLKLDMAGSTIRLLVDGIELVSVTDTEITAAGKAGLRISNASSQTTAEGLHIDNFSAEQAGSGSEVTGTVAYTNADDASAAEGTTTITGSSATTNTDDTSAAQGSPVVDGTSDTTNTDDISFASGAVGSAIVGTVSYTNINDVSEAEGTTTVTGSIAVTNANDTSSVSGTTTVTASAATTNANDVSAATGEVTEAEIIGTVEVTNADDVSAASGTTKIIGASTTTNTNDASAAFTIVNNGTIIESGLTTGSVILLRIKKPGIPVGTPEWLRTMLEIVIGRRGNKIDIPKFEELTFSATPTQAECEALYAYTNKTRAALDQLITRLDS